MSRSWPVILTLTLLAVTECRVTMHLDHAEQLARAALEEAMQIEQTIPGMNTRRGDPGARHHPQSTSKRAWEEQNANSGQAMKNMFTMANDLTSTIFGTHNVSASTSTKKHGSDMKKDPSSCAVVFNSGTLLKQQEGDKIDQHDWIIRMNMASTAGHEKNVGSKTTHQIIHIGSEEKFFKNKDSTTAVLFPVTSLETGPSGQAMRERASREKLNLVMGKETQDDCRSFYALDVDIDGKAPCRQPGQPGQRAQGCLCSSGGYAVLWALSRCKSVDVYGYTQDPCYPFHYDQPVPSTCAKSTEEIFTNVPDTSWHNFALEKVKMQKLRSDGKLNIQS